MVVICAGATWSSSISSSFVVVVAVAVVIVVVVVALIGQVTHWVKITKRYRTPKRYQDIVSMNKILHILTGAVDHICLCDCQLTHWGRVTHIYFNKLAIIGPANGLSSGRRKAIIWTNWNIRNKLQWNHKRNLYIFIQENVFENVVCEMAAMLPQPQCVKSLFSLVAVPRCPYDGIHPDPNDCKKYYNCAHTGTVHAIFFHESCPDGLLFNPHPDILVCDWPQNVWCVPNQPDGTSSSGASGSDAEDAGGSNSGSSAGEPDGPNSGSGAGEPDGPNSGSGTGEPDGPNSGSGTGEPDGPNSGSGAGEPDGPNSGSGAEDNGGSNSGNGTEHTDDTNSGNGAGDVDGSDPGNGGGDIVGPGGDVEDDDGSGEVPAGFIPVIPWVNLPRERITQNYVYIIENEWIWIR